MKHRKLFIGLFLVLLPGAAWYWFRPELLFINSEVQEDFPGARGTEAVLLAEGRFHGVAHETIGNAAVYQLPEGRRVLRLTDFATSNGPDVHVFLVGVTDADDSRTVKEADTIDLGSLKGNKGNQNYDLPADVDLGRFRAATIWCRRFRVNFATAPFMARGAKRREP